MRIRQAAAWLLISVAAPVAAEGELVYGKPDGSQANSMRVGADAVRMEQAGQSTWMLYRDGEKALYVVDDANRSYQKIDKESADAMRSKMDAMMAQMEAQLANLPPEQREMMPKMPGGGGAQNYRVEQRNDSRKVGKWSCQTAVVLKNDQPEQELCMATPKSLGVSQSDYQLIKRMGQAMSSVAASFGAGSMSAVLDAMDRLPVEYRAAGAATAEAELMRVDKGTQPAELFKIPESYQARKLF